MQQRPSRGGSGTEIRGARGGRGLRGARGAISVGGKFVVPVDDEWEDEECLDFSTGYRAGEGEGEADLCVRDLQQELVGVRRELKARGVQVITI